MKKSLLLPSVAAIINMQVDLIPPSSLDRLDYDRSAVGQHLGYAIHNFVRIVSHAYYGVGPYLARVQDHYVERFGARRLAQLREGRYIATHYRVQSAAHGPEDRTRTHGYASHYAERANYAKAIEGEGCRHAVMRQRVTLGYRIRGARTHALPRAFEIREFVLRHLLPPSFAVIEMLTT